MKPSPLYTRSHRPKLGERPSESGLSRLKSLPWGLFVLALSLSTVGLVILFSASNGMEDPGRVLRQVLHVTMGMGVFFITAMAHERFFRRHAYWFFLFGLFLLLLVLLMGTIGMGARRWLDFRFVRLQPSEMMKVFVVLALARYFHDRMVSRTLGVRDTLISLLIILVPVGIIILQPDLGTAVLVAITGGVVIFVAGLPWKVIFVLFSGLALAFPVAWNMMHDYQKRRILTLFNPEADPLGSGYHIIQSKIAVGSGGLFGKGFLNGSQSHLYFLPEQHTDFIFSVLAEEWGFFGAVVLLILYILLISQCLLIAISAKDRFGVLLAAGVTASFSFPIIINLGMVIGLLPVVGVPLPLVSYGGSSMLTLMFSMGLLAHVHIRSKSQG